MQASGYGKPDPLAKILLWFQGTNGVRPKAKHNGCQGRLQISDRAKEIQRIKVLADQPEAE